MNRSDYIQMLRDLDAGIVTVYFWPHLNLMAEKSQPRQSAILRPINTGSFRGPVNEVNATVATLGRQWWPKHSPIEIDRVREEIHTRLRGFCGFDRSSDVGLDGVRASGLCPEIWYHRFQGLRKRLVKAIAKFAVASDEPPEAGAVTTLLRLTTTGLVEERLAEDPDLGEMVEQEIIETVGPRWRIRSCLRERYPDAPGLPDEWQECVIPWSRVWEPGMEWMTCDPVGWGEDFRCTPVCRASRPDCPLAFMEVS